MDFKEGLNGYSSFLVSVHWQIAGIIFQTGSIETLTAAITKLLFHLPSKKPGSGLRQKLFAGAGNVFVGFSHEDDTADSISGGYDGLDNLGCGWSWLVIHHRDFATVSGTKTFGFSVIDNSFQLAADQFSNEFLTSRTGSSYYLVVVGDAGKHAAELTHEVELGTPNLDHVEKFAEELEAAGIHTDRVSPLLLPPYARRERSL